MKYKKEKPPRLAERIFELFLKSEEKSTLAEDLAEYFKDISKEMSRLRACAWYWRHILVSILCFVKNSIYFGGVMFKNYLTIALRNIKKHFAYSFINILGLSIGMAVFILILLYVQFELSYDKYHADYQNIYRVVTRQPGNVYLGTDYFSTSPALLASTMKQDFPEVIMGTRVTSRGGIVTYGENKFSERIHFVDPDFTDIFTFRLINSNYPSPLSEPFTIFLTKSMAEKYFGDADPIGKTILFNNEFEFRINGVLEDVPANSHFRFDFLASIISLRTIIGGDWGVTYLNRWGSADFHSYIKLSAQADPANLQNKLPAFRDNYEGKDAHGRNAFELQPLTDIHLSSHNNFEIESNSYTWYLYLFASIGVFILLIGCFNYMSLSTAKSMQRMKEIGLRKVFGADRNSLIKQFLLESFVFSFFALIVGLLFTHLFLPPFSLLIVRDIPTAMLWNASVIMGIIIITIFVGLFSGFYPAFFLSKFHPVNVLKGEIKSGTNRAASLRNTLVVIQFTISVILIVCAQFIYQQRDFIKNKDLGFEKEQIFYTYLRDTQFRRSSDAFRNDLLQYPDIIDITSSHSLPVTIRSGSRFAGWEGKTEEESTLGIYRAYVDYNFLDFYGIELINGRNFSKDFSTDVEEAYIINKTAADYIGWKDSIGKAFSWGGSELDGKIIGVIEDFHFFPLQMPMDGLALKLTTSGSYISIKISPNNISQTIEYIENKWEEHSPNYPFEYSFLDDRIDRMYRTEQKLGESFNYFTFIAIFIACLGLFALASYTSQQKTKEIGIRKVLGASVLGIVYLLSRSFLRWVGLASIMAAPIAFYVMSLWLENFAYRIAINIWPFLISFLLSVIIALITISYQSIRAATANPVEALKYE